eukprot:COSAG01_NODE_11443_length_1918_cov_1.109597_3_plen_102_part_00
MRLLTAICGHLPTRTSRITGSHGGAAGGAAVVLSRREPPLSCRCALQAKGPFHSPALGQQGAQYAHLKFYALPWRPLGSIPARGLAQDRGAATVEGMLRCT